MILLVEQNVQQALPLPGTGRTCSKPAESINPATAPTCYDPAAQDAYSGVA